MPASGCVPACRSQHAYAWPGWLSSQHSPIFPCPTPPHPRPLPPLPPRSRFQQVYVDQPSVTDTISILRGLRERYELHHGVKISDSALVEAAVLSDRYIADRFLPGGVGPRGQRAGAGMHGWAAAARWQLGGAGRSNRAQPLHPTRPPPSPQTRRSTWWTRRRPS